MSKTFTFFKRAAVVLGLFFGTLSAWAIANEVLPPGAITPVGDVLAKLGVKIVIHVATNAELKAYPYGGTVERDGFYAPGDDGAAKYVHSTSACPFNSGAGDNGAQVRDYAGTGCWFTDLSKPLSAVVWGCKIDDTTDDLACWQAAVAAMGYNGNGINSGPVSNYGKTTGTILFPATSGTCSRLSATLQINMSGVTIRGDNPHASCFDPQFATGNGVQIGDVNDFPFDVRIEHVGFRSDVVHRTSGASLELFGDYNVQVDDVTCYDYYYTCIGADQGQYGVNYYLNRIRTEGTLGVFGISLGVQGNVAGGPIGIYAPIGVRITNSELDGNGHGGSTGAGLNVVNVSGLVVEMTNEDYNFHAIWVHPGAGQYASGWYMSDNQWDASDDIGILIDTSGGGKFTNNKWVTQWIATCGSSSNPVTCLLMQGPTNSIENNQLDIMELSAWGHGITINSARDLQLSGSIGGNGLQSNGSYHGLVIGTQAGQSVSDFTYNGRIGGSVGADATDPPNIQACAVYIPSGASVSNIALKGDFSGNQNAQVVCDSSGLPLAVDSSLVAPGVPWKSFATTMSCGSGSLATTGQNATMRYQLAGKTMRFDAALTAGTNGTCSKLQFTVPAPANNLLGTPFFGRETTTILKGVTSFLGAGASTADTIYADGTATGANGTSVYVSGSYELP